jgi:hypothetical protein
MQKREGRSLPDRIVATHGMIGEHFIFEGNTPATSADMA